MISFRTQLVCIADAPSLVKGELYTFDHITYYDNQFLIVVSEHPTTAFGAHCFEDIGCADISELTNLLLN